MGCGGTGDESGEPVGTAMLEISTVPAGALCLQVVGTGASAFNVTATLMPGSNSASVSLGRLPLGASTVNASVYNVACGSIGGTLASWVAEPQSVTFRAGVITNLTLNLRQNNTVTANANFIGNIQSMTVGYSTTGLVMSDGTTRVAGNWYPLNSGGIFTNANPSLTGIVELEAPLTYNAHGCARTNNQVLCWGSNAYGGVGPGVPVGNWALTPVAVGITDAKDIAVGGGHTCALRPGGNVFCWGLNSSGELGNGTTVNTSTPTSVAFIATSSDMIVAGYAFNCANTYAGVYCWGANGYGQVGDGTTTDRLFPTANGVEGTVSLAAGWQHACAVRADGTVRCWGYNGNGQLGDGTTTQRLTPTQIPGITDAVQVVAGLYHTCIRRQGGTVMCFGNNDNGQIGDGTATNRIVPTQVPGLSNVALLAGGFEHTCALLDNRSVTCWGWDIDAQSGDNSPGSNFKPTPAIIQ